jgi:lipid-A-disaccharide synthase-like uncharacterized protein
VSIGSILTPEHFWLALGLLGQGLFSMRFLVQWIASEKKGESIVPVAFWYFSISGGVLLLMYALWRLDPVFIIGQFTGLFIYGRNLYLIHRLQARNAPAG